MQEAAGGYPAPPHTHGRAILKGRSKLLRPFLFGTPSASIGALFTLLTIVPLWCSHPTRNQFCYALPLGGPGTSSWGRFSLLLSKKSGLAFGDRLTNRAGALPERSWESKALGPLLTSSASDHSCDEGAQGGSSHDGATPFRTAKRACAEPAWAAQAGEIKVFRDGRRVRRRWLSGWGPLMTSDAPQRSGKSLEGNRF